MSSHGAELSVVHVLRPASGGMRRHVEQLCGRLQARGVHVCVASASTLDLPSVPVHRVGIGAGLSPVGDLRSALAVARLAEQATAIHAHGLRGAWVGALASRLSRTPVVITAHNLAPDLGPAARRLLGWAFGRAAVAVCVSQAVAASLAPLGIDPGAMVVIPNGVDLAEFDGLPPAPAARADLGLPAAPSVHVVAAMGRLAPEKGFDVLVGAAGTLALQEPALHFVLAGAGPHEGLLRARLAEAGLTARFVMPGHVRDVRAVLACADAVAVPSRAEGQGLVALEAMAASKPVVASAVGGLMETVVDGVTGLLVPAGDAAALAGALARLLRDAGLRAAMGQAGRARAASLYTVEQMVASTLAVYRQAGAQVPIASRH